MSTAIAVLQTTVPWLVAAVVVAAVAVLAGCIFASRQEPDDVMQQVVGDAPRIDLS